MSLSKGAKRGIIRFNHQKYKTNRARYSMKKTEINLRPAINPIILAAAQAAAEAIHASVQIVPDIKENAVAPDQEGGEKRDVPVQPKVGQEGKEGGPFGAFGGRE